MAFGQIIATSHVGLKVEWDTILDNTGNSYNQDKAKFFAPRNGTYQFTIVSMNPENGNAFLALMVGEDQICLALASGAITQTGVCTRVVGIREGQDVWVKNPVGGGNTYYGNGVTSFSGVLLHPDVE